MQELREREVVKVIDGREFYRMELEDGTETHYLISKDGWINNPECPPNIKINMRNTNGRYLDKDGYSNPNIHINTKPRNIKMHRILAFNFITKPSGLNEIDHLDGDKLNNLLSNLRWCDRVTNQNNRKNKSVNPCDYDFIHWNAKKDRASKGYWTFGYRVNKKKMHIKSSMDLKWLVEFRNKWLKENNYPKCLDLNVI